MQERRQEQGNLKAVLGGGAEEAQGAVDVEDVAVAHAPLDPVEQAVELEPAEELAVPRGPLVADLDPDQHRAEQDGLRQRDVVAVDQPLGRDVLETQQAVLVAQVGEERRRRTASGSSFSSAATALKISSRSKLRSLTGRPARPLSIWRR